MSEPAKPTREEIVAILQRMGVKSVNDAFIDRCVELSANAVRQMAMLPNPPDKSLEPSHVFAPPMR
jgi:hypothetical protein